MERLIRELPFVNQVSGLAWSPDGTRLVVGGSFGAMAVMTTEGRTLWSHPEEMFGRRDGDERGAGSLRWSPDGRHIARAESVSPEATTVRLYDATSGEQLFVHDTGSSYNAIDFSPDGRLACTAAPEQIRILDVETGETLVVCPGRRRKDEPTAVAWAPGGARLASASKDGTVRMWDPATGRQTRSWQGSDGVFYQLAWASDGERLAGGSSDHTVRVWDAKSGREQVRFECRPVRDRSLKGQVHSISWSPDARFLAAGVDDETIRIFSADFGEELARLEGGDSHLWAVAFSPDGTRLASTSYQRVVRLWDVTGIEKGVARARSEDRSLFAYAARQAETVGRRAQTEPVARPRWVPRLEGAEGEYLGVLKGPSGVTGRVAILPEDVRRGVTGSTDGSVRCWDMATGNVLWEGREKHTAHIQDLVLSPDGRRVATASNDKTIRIWDAGTGECLRCLEGHRGWVWRLSWSPDGRGLASGAYQDEAVCIWNMVTGQRVTRLNTEGTYVKGVAWSSDGETLAISDAAGISIQIPERGKTLRKFGDNRNIHTLRWSNDGTRLATADGSEKTIRIWDPTTGNLLHSCHGHKGIVGYVAWSPDGQLLAAASSERAVRIWDPKTGQQVVKLDAPKDAWHVAWSPDGAFLASSHEGGSFRFWDTRHLVANPTRTVRRPRVPADLPSPLRSLPVVLAQLHRLRLSAPLALVRDLLDLTGGGIPEALAPLRDHATIREMTGWRWPSRARLGLVALLLRDLPAAGSWRPPDGTSPAALRDAVADALSGSEMPPRPHEPSVTALNHAAGAIDDRVLTLLTLLGADAVAADPGLPLRLLPRVPNLPPMSGLRRRLLGQRLDFRDPGTVQGQAGGSERAGIEARGSLKDLLPSQLALPAELMRMRYLRGELLYRTRSGSEPPRLRPAVVVLDVSPPTFGPIEATTRLAAHVIASSLLAAQVPVVLTLLGGEGSVHVVERREDLLEIWTRRSLEPADAAGGLRVARAMREALRDGPLEPVVVVLSQSFFGYDDEALPEVPQLRGLFVHYPGMRPTPALADSCQRWAGVDAKTSELSSTLAWLLG